MDTALKQFENESFMNMETYRQSGEEVKTPVWFVLDGRTLYVRTVNNSWKVKRLRGNPQVRVVPSDRVGMPRGEWVPAQGVEVQDGDKVREVKTLFDAKYGEQMRMFDEFPEEQMVTLAVTVPA